MELTFEILARVARSCIVSLFVFFILSQVARRQHQIFSPLSNLRATNSLSLSLVSFCISYILCFTYDAFIYPRFVTPLRCFPSVSLGDFRQLLPVTTAPRGEKALQWTKAHPGVDIVRIRVRAAPTLMAAMPISPNAHRDILSTNAYDFVKPDAGRNYLSSILGYGLVLSEGAEHKRQRKYLNPSFRIQNIRILHDLIAEKTKIMLRGLEEEMKSRGRVEIGSWGSRLTMDIIGPALMSRDFQALTSHESELEVAFGDLIRPSEGQTWLFCASLLLPQWIVRRIPGPTNKMLKHNVGIVRDICTNILDAKIVLLRKLGLPSGGQKKPSFVEGEEEVTSDILGSIMSAGEFSHSELVDQMMTFLAAGHETTASSIAWAAHLLTLPEYEHYQLKLHQEVNAAISSSPPSSTSEILSYEQLEQLPYLHGVAQEVLRLFPPVTNTARKAIRDTTVAGTKIPKNTIFIIFPWAVNRNPQFWGDDADVMKPERWIDMSTQRPNKHGGAPSNMCDMTFLQGNRSCIGKELARAELRYCLAALFAQFKMQRVTGREVIPAGSLTIKPSNGMYVSLTTW